MGGERGGVHCTLRRWEGRGEGSIAHYVVGQLHVVLTYVRNVFAIPHNAVATNHVINLVVSRLHTQGHTYVRTCMAYCIPAAPGSVMYIQRYSVYAYIRTV